MYLNSGIFDVPAEDVIEAVDVVDVTDENAFEAVVEEETVTDTDDNTEINQ